MEYIIGYWQGFTRTFCENFELRENEVWAVREQPLQDGFADVPGFDAELDYVTGQWCGVS